MQDQIPQALKRRYCILLIMNLAYRPSPLWTSKASMDLSFNSVDFISNFIGRMTQELKDKEAGEQATALHSRGQATKRRSDPDAGASSSKSPHMQ